MAQSPPRAVKTYHEGKPVYVSQPEQEPVAHIYLFDRNGRPRIAWDNAKNIKIGDKIYTTPPKEQQSCDKRPWVGLTEVEGTECWSPSAVKTWQAIEAKLKEKNT